MTAGITFVNDPDDHIATMDSCEHKPNENLKSEHIFLMNIYL